jgi:hypothetical protein
MDLSYPKILPSQIYKQIVRSCQKGFVKESERLFIINDEIRATPKVSLKITS